MVLEGDTVAAAGMDPRVRRSRDKILAATREILAERGYEGMTIEGVAAHAGVGKATIYRHWRSKAQMVIDAAAHLRKAEDPPPLGGTFERLCQLYGGLAERLADPSWSRSVASLIEAARRDSELEELYREFATMRRTPARRVLRTAVEQGELPDDTDIETAIDLVAGPLFYRRFFTQRPAGRDEVAGLVRRVLDHPPRRRGEGSAPAPS